MSSTGISLNERFTVLSQRSYQQQPEVGGNAGGGGRSRGRSRSRSRSRQFVPDSPRNQNASASNLRLLNELQRRHTGGVQKTALKLKRRSMRTANNGNAANKRVGVKSLRLSPNGKPIRTNSVNRNATMRADFVANNIKNRGIRNLRRGNLISNNNVKRFGSGRPTVGGAAERISKRRIQQRGSIRQPQQYQQQGAIRRGRSRSRSRGPDNSVGRSRSRSRVPENNNVRSRSRSRGPANNNVRSRSRSHGPENNVVRRSESRGRTPSRIRGRQSNRERSAPRVPIKDRLGVRPGAARNANTGRGVAPANRNKRGISGQRNANNNKRTVANGRVQKRIGGNTNAAAAKSVGGAAGRGGRRNGRFAARNAVDAGAANARRSRSRTRVNGGGSNVQKRLQRPGSGGGGNNAAGSSRRGRSQNRGNASNGGKNGNKQNNRQQQQQQRRGRSQSRGRNPRAKNTKSDIKKEDLDTELDQYMATTKTDMDYLLK